MKASIEGSFYNDVILELSYPEVVNISAADYVAKTFTGPTLEEKQRPFLICAKEEVTLKVESWTGNIVVWTFAPGPYPMPLKRILKDAANTATTIQISY